MVFNRELPVQVAGALLALLLIAPSVCHAAEPAPTPTPAELTAPEQRIENVIAAATHYLGVPYQMGAEGPDKMDCSGLVYRAFMDAGEGRRMSGARLGVRSYVRWFAARGGLVLDAADAVRGDLAIYGAGQHMGIYLGDGRVISAITRGVTVHAMRGIGLELTGFLRPDWEGKGRVEPLDPSLLLDQGETPVDLVPPSAWAPALDPALQPEQVGIEREDMRTATSRTFANADGTFSTEFHAQPIYYRPADAEAAHSTAWLPIDLRFATADQTANAPAGAVVAMSPVVVSAYPSATDTGFLTLTSAARSIAVAGMLGEGVESAAPVIGASGRTVDYFDFFGDGAGLRVYAEPDGMRSFLVLGASPARSQFTFKVSGHDLVASAQPDGSVALVDAAGDVFGRIPLPQLIDSSDVTGDGGGVFTAATSLSVATADDGAQLVTVTVARRFLEEAVYPAFVDFAITDFPTVAPGADLTVVSSEHPNATLTGAERPEQPFYGESWLGRQPGSRNDNVLYLRFDDPRAVIGDATVRASSLDLYPYWVGGEAATFNLRGLSTDTTEPLSWLTRPIADVDLGQVTLTQGEWSHVDLGEAPQMSLTLEAAQPGAGSWARLIARDQADGIDFGPRLVVNWTSLRPSLGPGAETQALAPELAWTSAPIAGVQRRYEIQVSNDAFATTVVDSNVVRGAAGSATSWTVPTDDLASGDYLARVRTRSDENGWSDWSAPFAFQFGPTVIGPTPLSALEVVHTDD